MFVDVHEQVGVAFLLARFQIQTSTAERRSSAPEDAADEFGFGPSPPWKKTKRKNKNKNTDLRRRGEGEGQTQTSNLFGEEKRKNPPSSQTRESHILVPDPLPA